MSATNFAFSAFHGETNSHACLFSFPKPVVIKSNLHTDNLVTLRPKRTIPEDQQVPHSILLQAISSMAIG